MRDTQSKIFEITQDVTVNKAKTADKAFAAMDGYINSSRVPDMAESIF